MYASPASRCACRELNFCSSPSSLDFRVSIAHRTAPGSLTDLSLLQAEEQISVPARTGHLIGDRTQGAKPLFVVGEAILLHPHHNLLPAVAPLQIRAGVRQPRIASVRHLLAGALQQPPKIPRCP